ncbi:MAG: hypothetical protein NTU74_02095, partial [Deltaproteobacteria bacterium]|nr:hypothetical protein [Deltaproteobacteria bacterium]
SKTVHQVHLTQAMPAINILYRLLIRRAYPIWASTKHRARECLFPGNNSVLLNCCFFQQRIDNLVFNAESEKKHGRCKLSLLECIVRRKDINGRLIRIDEDALKER